MMNFLIVISLLLGSGHTTLTDDVVFEYSRFYSYNMTGIGITDTLIPDIGYSDGSSVEDNRSAKNPSAELERIFYRSPRDSLTYAWRLTLKITSCA